MSATSCEKFCWPSSWPPSFRLGSGTMGSSQKKGYGINAGALQGLRSAFDIRIQLVAALGLAVAAGDAIGEHQHRAQLGGSASGQ